MVPRIFTLSLVVIVAVVTLLALGLGGGYLWLRTSLPQTSGSVTLAGLGGPVEVRPRK